MIIVGAGLAGLLAAHALREFRPTVMEAQNKLPHNHQALLRFRSDRLETQFGIPLKKVLVAKGLLDEDNCVVNYSTIRDNNAYSLKVTGQLRRRSIGNMIVQERWVAPNDLQEQLAVGVNIQFRQRCSEQLFEHQSEEHPNDRLPVISTMPMPVLMKLVGWQNDEKDGVRFDSSPITVVRAKLPGCDLHQTLYAPYGNVRWYRASLVGEDIIVEMKDNVLHIQEAYGIVASALHHLVGSVPFADVTHHKQPLGKIIDVDKEAGRQFVMYATDKYNTYSVGRFALWRNIVTDDVMDDLDVVRGMLRSKSSYQRRLHASR